MDSHLQMTSQVNSVCKSAYLSLRNIGKIRKYINHTCSDCERLVHAFNEGLQVHAFIISLTRVIALIC
jgi:hypothetical protein